MNLPRRLQRLLSQYLLHVALAALAPACVSAQGAVAGADAAQAILKTQDISFYYQSFDVSYSCEGIETKVTRVLQALGADKDLKVEAKSCSDGRDLLNDLASSPRGAPTRSPYVTIHVTSAVEATPEVLAELANTRSQRELAARVQGDSTAALRAETQFLSPWKPVSLSRASVGLEPADCELVVALRKNVLPKLGVRVVKDKLRCVRQSNRQQPQLQVEVLSLPPHPENGFAVPPAADAANPGEATSPEGAPAPDKPQN